MILRFAFFNDVGNVMEMAEHAGAGLPQKEELRGPPGRSPSSSLSRLFCTTSSVYSDHFRLAENTTRAVFTYATRVRLNENK